MLLLRLLRAVLPGTAQTLCAGKDALNDVGLPVG